MNAWQSRAGALDIKRFSAALLFAAIALVGFRQFATLLDAVYPISTWLFWTVARVWGGTLLFNAACLCFGHFVLVRLLRQSELPLLESAVLGTCIGVFGFAAAMFAAGLWGGFVPSVAIGLPIAMLLCGAWSVAEHWQRAQSAALRVRPSALSRLLAAAAVMALLLLYLQTFTPDAINYDAGWMHVKFAEDYARHGRLVPFPGSYHGGLPHLKSLLDTWAYLLPGLRLSERWMLVLHLEFALVLWTLAAIAATVRRMLGHHELTSSWTAFFLFPGIFVYDSNLGGAADHVLAYFSMCVVLVMLRVIANFSLGACVSLAVAAAGALLTKYQAFYVLVPAALIIAVAWLRAWPGAKSPQFRATLLRAPFVLGGVAAVLIAPHFIKNWVYYHNPVYPLMQPLFTHSTPSVPNGAMLLDQLYTDANWVPPGGAYDKFARALRLFPSFSFQPHYTFHGNAPVFGSLFTLLLPAIPLLRARKPIALVAFIASVALLLWGYTYNVDRNLQTFMPVLAAVVAAIVAQAWTLGWLARAGLIALLGLQVVWGADATVFTARERITSSLTLITSGFDQKAINRLEGFRAGYRAIGAALPLHAQVLLHTSHVSLGIDRDIIQDWAGYQGLIDYGPMRTPRDVFERYRKLGITHMLDEGERRFAPSKQEDVLYQVFARRHAKRMRQISGYRLFTMPDTPPPVEAPYRVLCKGLAGYEDGLYPIEKLNTIQYLPPYLQTFQLPSEALTPERTDALLQQADAVLCGIAGCSDLLTRGQTRFEWLSSYANQFSIYAARR